MIGAGVVTVSELAVFGHQIGNSKRSTGLLGGKAGKSEATPTPTPTATVDRDADADRDPDADRDRDRDRDGDGHSDPERNRHGDPDRRHRHPDPAGVRHGSDTGTDALVSRDQVAKDRVPTSRLTRTARVSSLAAGQAARQLGTHATNLARSRGGQGAPRSSAATSRPRSRSSPRSGR